MDTHGWDILSACSQKKLNTLLKSRMSSAPPKVSYSDGKSINIDAVFDPWEITSFGSDNVLTVELPIKSGTLKNTKKFSAHPSIDLAGAALEVFITLEFVDDAKGDASDLSFSLKTKATNPAEKSKAGMVSVKSADITGVLKTQDPSGAAAVTLSEHIVDALIANADKLSYALSSVNLQPGKDWLKPKVKAHMFAQGPKTASGAQGEGYLVVATMVRDLPEKSRTHDIDPGLFDSRNDFFMLIAGEVFLEHFILPSIGSGFVGKPQQQFRMVGDDVIGIGALTCPEVDHWGTGYTPILTSFLMSIDGAHTVTKANGLFQITGLGSKAYVTFSIQQNASCSYDATKNSVAFTRAPGPDPDYTKHIPWYEWAAAAPLLPFFGPFIAAIVAGVMDSVMAAVVDGVTHSVTQTGSTGGLSGLSAVAVSWPGSGTTTVEECGLSGAFYLRGNIG